jgi:hypothetical protein
MIKIPCLFERDFSTKPPTLLRAVTPGCEWVLEGEGCATVKWDGTACMVNDGVLYKRYDAKRGKEPPPHAIPCTPQRDPETGHWPHWVRVSADGKSGDKHHRKAWDALDKPLPDGTYELCGPKVNGNPHSIPKLVFWEHGSEELAPPPVELTWGGIRHRLEDFRYEGIVFHHRDGRMAKIRRADYGLSWPVK